MRNLPFKKLATVTAVAATLGTAGLAQANLLGVPGNAVLVPLAQYSTKDNTNTMVGITVPLQADDSAERRGLNGLGACTLDTDLNDNATSAAAVTTGIRWFFFDHRSVHQADGTLRHTLNDFVPFDWRAEATRSAAIKEKTDGKYGYLIFATQVSANDGLAATSPQAPFCFFADAMWIRGVWESAAYIPTYALWDTRDNAGNTITTTDQITYAGGEPRAYNPAITGMLFNDGDGNLSDIVHWDMRYFLTQTGALKGDTTLVVWLPFNGHSNQPRTQIPVDVWDTGENGNSTNIDLPDELNVVDASEIGWTDWTANEGSGVGGKPVTGADREGESQGFITFDMPEVAHVSEYQNGQWVGSSTANFIGYSWRANENVPVAGAAFSLVGFESGGNANQIQTVLGHQRGIFQP